MTSGEETQELTEVPRTSEADLSPQKQVYRQLGKLISNYPDKFAVETRESDFLSMFRAHTLLVTSNDEELLLSMSLDREKSSGELSERFIIQLLKPHKQEKIYRLDVKPAGEIGKEWKEEMSRIEKSGNQSETVQAFRKILESHYEDGEIPLLFIDSYAESQLRSADIIELEILSSFKELRFPPKMTGKPSLAQLRKGIKTAGQAV